MKTFSYNDVLRNIPNDTLYIALFDYARSKGVPIYHDTSKRDYEEYPNISFSCYHLTPNKSTDRDSCTWINYEKFFEYCDNWNKIKDIEIKLNDNYNAIIKDGVVLVGCQTFEFEAIRKLYDAINEQS